jgi:hypothetical protein
MWIGCASAVKLRISQVSHRRVARLRALRLARDAQIAAAAGAKAAEASEKMKKLGLEVAREEDATKSPTGEEPKAAASLFR